MLGILTARKDRLLLDAKALLDTAAKENRALTADETKQHDEWLKSLETLAPQIAAAKGQEDGLAAFDAQTGGAIYGPGGPPNGRMVMLAPMKSIGQLVIEGELGKWLKESKASRPERWHSPSIEVKATVLEGTLPEPDRIAGIIPTATRPITVVDLPATGTTTSNVVGYMRELTFVNAANSVAEGAAKPESTITFDLVNDPVRKIAHWLPVSEEALDDLPQLRSYLDSRLALGVRIETEDQLLNGTTTAPDIIGYLNRVGLAAPVVKGVAPDTNADAILRQAQAIEIATGMKPDGVILNPVNWNTIVSAKLADGSYVAGSPFDAMTQPTLWGMRVAVTPTIVANTALVGAFKSASQIYWREFMRIDLSNSHQDFFVKNLVAIRAEVRLALAVYKPAAFGTVTGLT